MKLLDKGKLWSIKLVCTGNGSGGCGSHLLVEEGDIFQTFREDMQGSVDYYFTFRCSECGVLTNISDSKVGRRLNKFDLPHYQTWLRRRRQSEKAAEEK